MELVCWVYAMVEAASLVRAIAQGASVKAFGVYMDQRPADLLRWNRIQH